MLSVAAKRCVVLSLFCGSAVADFVVPDAVEGSNAEIVVKTRSEPLTFEHVSSTPIDHHLYKDTTMSYYSSKPMKLKTGQTIFTLPDVTTLKMPQPGRPYALTALNYDIIETQTGRSVPLSEMYGHHWLVYDRLVGGDGYNVGCGGPNTWVSNVFGAGGEMRGVPYVYPDGYGLVVPGNRHWSANIHFIRTEDLNAQHYGGSVPAATKACIECDFAWGKGLSCVPGLQGFAIFGCCFDGCRCPVNNPHDKSYKSYSLVYNVTWTTDVQAIKPLNVYVIDVFHCGIVNNLKPNKHSGHTKCDDKMCVSTATRTMPVSGTIHWAYGHQHQGAHNLTFSINGIPACTSFPHIGTDPHDMPGMEKGYAVGFKMCVDPASDKPIHVNKGDSLTVTAMVSVDEADTRFAPFPGGSHTGMMGLFYFWYHEGAEADRYACSSGKCVADSTGVPLEVCQAACGGSAALV